MSEFLAPDLQKLAAYVPGEQPQDKRYIKLNTNENPYYPSERVVKAITEAEVKNLRLYSDPDSKTLIAAIAQNYGLSEKNVVVGNGSDEILAFSFRAFGQNGACFPEVTYGFYKVFADMFGVKKEILPLTAEFKIDASSYFNKNKLVVLANPNAQTGIALPLSDIEKIAANNEKSVVLVDEAYVDFGGESAVGLTKKYKNLVVVQTFSKSRSLAGARVGFAVADEALISDLAAHNIQNRTVGIVENGSWAPTSGGLMRKQLEKCDGVTFIENTVSIRSSVSPWCSRISAQCQWMEPGYPGAMARALPSGA